MKRGKEQQQAAKCSDSTGRSCGPSWTSVFGWLWNKFSGTKVVGTDSLSRDLGLLTGRVEVLIATIGVLSDEIRELRVETARLAGAILYRR